MDIETLSDDFAKGKIDVDELERGIELSLASNVESALVPAHNMRIIAGSIEKIGPWRVPQQLSTRVLWGHLLLDLREAKLSSNTLIEVHITMGNVEVIVPPGVDVEVDASSFMAHVEERIERTTTTGTRPLVRVVGRVKLGNLELTTMRPGETRGDARRRRHADRRARRHWHRRSFGEW